MRVGFLAALRLWWAYRRHPWCRPHQGWLRWALWNRRVAWFQDPVCEGGINDAAPASEFAPTVRLRKMGG